MEYRTLGRSGLRISRLSLGAMTFGTGTGLERLGRDHIDLFQLHDRDALVPIEETLRAAELPADQFGKGRPDRVSQPEVTYPHWMQHFHDRDRVLS